MRSVKKIVPAFLAWSLLIILATACENTISPLSEDSDRVFAIHGFLDMAADTQFVRISNLRETVLSDVPPLENVVVKTIGPTPADEILWTASSITLGDGSVVALFYAVFEPISESAYELQIVKDGSIAARARTSMPGRPDYFANVPSGDTLSFTQIVVLQGVSGRPFDVSVAYNVSRPAEEQAESVVIEYEQDGMNVLNGWQFEVYLKRDQFTVFRDLDWPLTGPPLELKRVSASVAILGPEWAEEGTPKNLENAHGFFGSIGRFELPWILNSADVDKIGFVDKQNPF